MRLIGLLFIVAISILNGCSYQTQSENFVIWDNSHFSVFGIENFRDFVTILGSHGLGVKTSNNLKDLQGKCLIIAGSTSTYTEDEIEEILGYVRNGGKLLVMIHIPPEINLDPLLTGFGFNISSRILLNEDGNTSVVVNSFEESIITQGLNRVIFFGCYYTDNAIASCECFADMDGDKVPDAEEKGVFGVIGYKKFGKGEVVVITDDAVLMDGLIDHADNKKLAENIALWIQFS
ncbi:MAG TPA: hypothetical protein EYP30_05565 [Archaeoglobaceae archaeon]|nr:hypothetical protein [Archaeoglobaceae archaeon]